MTTHGFDLVHGFDLLEERALKDIDSTARLYRHARTGAELLSLVNADENKVFGISFRTPPRDSTGVAHILEHSVLCGSEKYRAKAPFVQLRKGSLASFINAFTFPDMTCYPVASQNLQDFYNLIDVYLDAVFHPLISRETFEQEGWHYEIDAPDAALSYKGVVFNEMKGNYSSPDNMLQHFSRSSLYPDITYGLDSGGDPKRIPDLTYEQFRAFHRTYYCPSNARLFFCGDDDPTERLKRLDERLSAFERVEVDSKVALQPRFAAPKRFTHGFAAGEDEAQNKAMVTVNWMLGEVGDAVTAQSLTLLDLIVSGTPASPLQKALIDSGLGEAFTGGLDTQLRQPSYSAGLKNIEPENAGKIEALILETLTGLAENGIDTDAVEAALNTLEFSLREYNTGSFPRGIALMITALRGWLYDRDAMTPLTFETALAAIRARLAAGERYFEGLIREHLLANPHRTTVLLTPDPAKAEREAAEERARLDAARAHMSDKDVEAAVATTQALKRLQATPDTQEALAAIPSLTLADLPRRNRLIPLAEDTAGDTRILFHDLVTHQVIYLDIGFDLHRLPADLLPYMSLFSLALTETGVGSEDFVTLSRRIQHATGGVYAAPWIAAARAQGKSAAFMMLRAKIMPDKAPELFGILEDVLTKARLDNRERFRQLVLETKSSLEDSLVPAGSHYAYRRLFANLHEAHWANEKISGIDYLFFLRKLARDVDADWESVRGALERLKHLLIDRAGMICNVTTDAANWRSFEPRLRAFLDRLPASAPLSEPWRLDTRPRFEGLAVAATVNFVAKGGDAHLVGYRPTGATSVALNHLNNTWLWEKVRVEGGAYGVSLGFDRHSGAFAFTSYRDPNLEGTLEVYDGSAAFLRGLTIGDAELTRNIIGVIGGIDAYQTPDHKGWSSMANRLIGDTDDDNQRWRDEVLSATAADFRKLADVLAELAAQGNVVVMGSETAIAEANAGRKDKLEVTKIA